MKKVKYIVNEQALSHQLATDDVTNWLAKAGTDLILEGKTPGKNMIHYLEIMGLITESKYK